jgi:hypothetical protein
LWVFIIYMLIKNIQCKLDYESGIDSGQVYQDHKYKVINDISREKKLGWNVLESSLHCMFFINI